MAQISPPQFATRSAGNVVSAEIVNFELKYPKSRKSTAQKLGLAFEKKAIEHLRQELTGDFCAHPTFRFNNGQRLDQFAVPDSLYLFDDIVTIFEIKLSHTADAYYQLYRLYKPILAAAYPSLHINLCEICRFYDRTVKLPYAPYIIDSLSAFCQRKHDQMGLYLWSR